MLTCTPANTSSDNNMPAPDKIIRGHFMVKGTWYNNQSAAQDYPCKVTIIVVMVLNHITACGLPTGSDGSYIAMLVAVGLKSMPIWLQTLATGNYIATGQCTVYDVNFCDYTHMETKWLPKWLAKNTTAEDSKLNEPECAAIHLRYGVKRHLLNHSRSIYVYQ